MPRGSTSYNVFFDAAGAVRAFRASPHLRLRKIIMTLPAASPNVISQKQTSQKKAL
jgi:hypothetical protein